MTRRRDADGGFTLAEMLVVIVLFGLVGGAIAVVVTTTLRHQADIQNRATALDQARTALERIDQDVRAAAPLTAGGAPILAPTTTGNTLRLTQYPKKFSTAEAATVRTVTYTLSGTDLTESYTDVLGATSTTTGPIIVARNVTNTTANPMFSYDATTEVLTTSISIQPPTVNKPVTVSDGGTAVRNPPPPPTT